VHRTIILLKKKTECHKLRTASGYVSKNGCEWDSNTCPYQLETYLVLRFIYLLYFYNAVYLFVRT